MVTPLALRLASRRSIVSLTVCLLSISIKPSHNIADILARGAPQAAEGIWSVPRRLSAMRLRALHYHFPDPATILSPPARRDRPSPKVRHAAGTARRPPDEMAWP